MIVIGVTGGVGSGKSALLEKIAEKYRCRIIYSDDAAKQTEKPGGLSYESIVELLGKDILDEEGVIINSKMAAKIFADSELLKKTNAIIHPAVKQYILNEIEAEKELGKVELFIIEAALLIEDGYDKICDELWYVYAPTEIRRARLKESRGYTDEKIDRMFDSQLTEEEFRKGCKRVIDNGGTIDAAIDQVDDIMSELWRK
ncbi:MAG: dephospho-CoA kinase [Lachnospiraceae bacterium]|nr:dephospho-CoA kinase [Candidatus Merdinaster equi]